MTRPPDAEQLTVQGVYFDGRSSRDQEATLRVLGDAALLRVATSPEGAATEARWPLGHLKIEPPLTRLRRVVLLPDGGRFETSDDAAVTALEQRLGRNRGARQVRRVESSWALTLGALVLLGGFVWGFLTYGLPFVARNAAAATPRAVVDSFDRSAAELLDRGAFLGPSELSAARQARLQAAFQSVTRWAGGNYRYRLLLRSGEPENPDGQGFPIGANAFALPGGTIVMTDQLVALSKSDRELIGVLAHEVGHVTGRHTLSSVYQGLGLTLLTTAVTGDLVSAGTFAAALPTALLKNGYSRQAETASDELAARYLLERYGTTKPLRDILARLEKNGGNASEDSLRSEDDADDFLQTHPGTYARIEHLRALEQASKAAQR